MTEMNPMLPGGSELAEAFENALHRIAPGITIVTKVQGAFTAGQNSDRDRGRGQDPPATEGGLCVKYFGDTGCSGGGAEHRYGRPVSIIAVDHTLDQMVLLRKGEMDSVIVQDMRSLGKRAVQNIVRTRGGHTVPSEVYEEPVLVTRENIHTEAIQQMLIMDWRRTG